MDSVGEKVRNAVTADEFHQEFIERVIANMGLSEASRKYGVGVTTIQGWMNGSFPSAYTLLKVAKWDRRDAAMMAYGATPKEERSVPKKAKPASASSAASGAPMTLSPELRLTKTEEDALLHWLLLQVRTMPIERPLTKAVRKIAMQLSGDTDLLKFAAVPGQVVEVASNSSTDAPTPETPAPRRQPVPSSSTDASSSNTPPTQKDKVRKK